jgi:hypothetical protein
MYLWKQKSPALLGFYRPNQAANRVYSGYGLSGLGAPAVLSIARMQAVRPLSGLGDDVTVDSSLLLPGIGLLAAAMFLFGSKHGPQLRKRRAARLRRKLQAIEG